MHSRAILINRSHDAALEVDKLPDLAGLKIVIFRTLAMFWITLIAVRTMGKRSIAQLAPFDLTVIIIIGSAAALPLEDESISLWNGIVPILILSFLQYLLSVINLHWRAAEKVTQGTSTPLVVNGKILHDNRKMERVSLSDLHIVLRQKGVDRIEDVALAVLEPTGEVSVILKEETRPLTAKDIDILNLSRLDDIMTLSSQRLRKRYNEISKPQRRRNFPGWP
ncbi:MAG: DUF421 domain-containing protein [Bacillota bacterium]|jgi:uncharacterized membrane protein YcaP (DUF421 family)|nr:DUF421 domain-containing protein [Candidatus Fermentithermobacillaceae bacterium]HOA70475.1 DUF421 domain-containing protein [Bacillota bacterium]HOP71415.1 DUF421 domain-containing protein [Bacillota bacterium]HPT35236.1 DUF421 domain-containing protein [Bacillota bacterium]HPZ85294.1 DUF421 domain-containing protein [Bacillota bacterium]